MITAEKLKKIANLTELFKSTNNTTQCIIKYINTKLEYNTKINGEIDFNFDTMIVNWIIHNESPIGYSISSDEISSIDYALIKKYYTKLNYNFDSNHKSFIRIAA